jgi:hypothetical protein
MAPLLFIALLALLCSKYPREPHIASVPLHRLLRPQGLHGAPSPGKLGYASMVPALGPQIDGAASRIRVGLARSPAAMHGRERR